MLFPVEIGPFILVVASLGVIFQILPQIGTAFDRKKVSFKPGETRPERSRRNAYFYTVFLAGLIAVAASYSVGIGASVSASSLESHSTASFQTGLMIAGASLIVVEALLILMGVLYIRSDTANVWALRADIEREIAQTSIDNPIMPSEILQLGDELAVARKDKGNLRRGLIRDRRFFAVFVSTEEITYRRRRDRVARMNHTEHRRFTWRWMFSLRRAFLLAWATWALVALVVVSVAGVATAVLTDGADGSMVAIWAVALALSGGLLCGQYFYAQMTLLYAARMFTAFLHAKRRCIAGIRTLEAIRRRQRSPAARLKHALFGT